MKDKRTELIATSAMDKSHGAWNVRKTSYLRVLAACEEIASQFPVLWPGLWAGASHRVSLNAAFLLGQNRWTMNHCVDYYVSVYLQWSIVNRRWKNRSSMGTCVAYKTTCQALDVRGQVTQKLEAQFKRFDILCLWFQQDFRELVEIMLPNGQDDIRTYSPSRYVYLEVIVQIRNKWPGT